MLHLGINFGESWGHAGLAGWGLGLGHVFGVSEEPAGPAMLSRCVGCAGKARLYAVPSCNGSRDVRREALPIKQVWYTQ